MAEVIPLATFELDTKKLETSLSSLQDKYFDLKKEQSDYANQTKETKKQIDLLTKSQELLTNSAGDNTDALEENKKQLDALNQKDKELFKSQQNLSTSMSVVKKEINQTTNQLKSYQDAEAKTTSLIVLGNAAIDRQIKNKNDAKAANIALNAVSNQLNPNIEEEALLLAKVNKQIDLNTEFIKDNSSETAKQKMNVGNYQSALEGVDAVLGQFGINGQQARTVVSGFTSTVSKAGSDIVGYSNSVIQATASTLGFKTASTLAAESQAVQVGITETQAVSNVALATSTEAVTVATTASTLGLKAFTIALASTGIGLIVIGIGALFSYLKDLDPLLDKVEQGFSAIGAVVRVLGAAIANLSFDGLGESMSKAADEAIKLKAAQQDLADLQNSQEVANAKASQQYDELILKSKNRTLSEKERIAFLQQAQKIETDNYVQRANLAQAELNQSIKNAQIKGELSNQEIKNLRANTLAYGTYLLNKGKITEADLELIKKAELGKIAIDAESTKRLEKNQNAQDKLYEDAKKQREKDASDRQAADQKRKQAEEKRTSELLKQSKAEIDLFIAQQGFKKKSLQEEYDFNTSLYEKETADLKLQLDKKQISQTQYDAQILQLRNSYLSKNVEITAANAQLELNAELEKNVKILESTQYLSNEQSRLKKEALDNDLKAQQFFYDTQLESGIINQQQYDDAIAKSKAENKTKQDQIDADAKAQQKEKQLIDLENQKVTNEKNFLAQAEIEKAQNEIKRQQEVSNAEQTGASIAEINSKYAQLKKDVDQQLLDQQLKSVADTFGGIAEILGENSKAGKAAAIAQATINTYQGVTAAWMAPAVLPQPFDSISKIVASGVALASGLKAVKSITATKQPSFKKPSYASGVIGLRGIGSGTSDDINANLSVGESVINARSTSMFPNELAAINQAGGGVGLNGGSNILNQNDIQQKSDNSQLVSAIASAVALGAELGTNKGSQSGIKQLSSDRKVMENAKF